MSSLDNLPIYVGVFTVLWIYLPGFLINTFAMLWGKWLPKTGYGPWPIDGGKVAWDGNRLFGDGKTWNGLIGGSLTSGLLCYLQFILSSENSNIFINPIQGWESSLLGSTNEFTVAFCVGTFLGFTALLGDMTGSFFKRRKGLKREGDTSSKDPLLDTLPFAVFTFAFGYICLGAFEHSSNSAVIPILVLLILTPIIHRLFNILGYKIGWKDVPY